jgi:hypothetical protein
VKGAILKADETRLYDDIARAAVAIDSMATGRCAGWTPEQQRTVSIFCAGFNGDYYAFPPNLNGIQYVMLVPF